MATYSDLKSRIISEMVRDELEDDRAADLARHIQAAIRFYQNRNWWFLKKSGTVPTVAAQNYITRPAGYRQITRISIPALGIDLDHETLEDLESLDEPTAQTGQPQAYAEGAGGATLRLWPTPNAVFTLKVIGSSLLADLSDDADDTVWTNDLAQDLICAHAKMTLFRDIFRDPDAARDTIGAVKEALSAIERENTTRGDLPVRPSW